MAYLDGLTGLLNHSRLIHLLNEEYNNLAMNSSFSFLMIDIDYFKRVNDNYGHISGDMILKEVSNILVTSNTLDTIIGRYGGEEFGIVLPNCDLDTAILISESILLRVKEHKFQTTEGPMSITLSCGICHVKKEDTIRIMALIKRADDALYQAKHNGRDQYCVYNEGLLIQYYFHSLTRSFYNCRLDVRISMLFDYRPP